MGPACGSEDRGGVRPWEDRKSLGLWGNSPLSFQSNKGCVPFFRNLHRSGAPWVSETRLQLVLYAS